MAYHGDDVCGGSCVGHHWNFWYYFHRRKATERKSLEIRRSGFNFKLNPTSAIGNFANHDIQQAMFPAMMSWPMTNLSFYIKSSNSAFDRPLRKRYSASDWPDPQIPPHRRGKWHTMVMMFVGEVLSIINRNLVLFPPQESYGAEVFCSCQNSYRD